MNTYQKVLVCIFRTIGIFAMLYALVVIVTTFLIAGGATYMIGVASAGMVVIGLILYYAAKPLSRVITAGLD